VLFRSGYGASDFRMISIGSGFFEKNAFSFEKKWNLSRAYAFY